MKFGQHVYVLRHRCRDVFYFQTLFIFSVWDFIPKRQLTVVNIVLVPSVLLHSPGFNSFPDTSRKLNWPNDCRTWSVVCHFCQSNCATRRNQSLLEGSLDLLQADCSDLSFRAQRLPTLRFKKPLNFVLTLDCVFSNIVKGKGNDFPLHLEHIFFFH